MPSTKIKGYLHALKPQIIVIGIILILQIPASLGFIPGPNEIMDYVSNLFATHGLPLIILASFIENFAGLGTYFPGSIAILAAMALTAGHPALALLTFIAIVIPAIIANILSYFIGYYNRDKESALPFRSGKSLFMWYAATYWHPQLAAVSATASGGEGIKFGRYASHFLPVSLVWSIFWAVLLYNAGKVASSTSIFTPLFYCYLVGWILWDIRKHYLARKKIQS